jgi:AhpD family alkylhydroperoxidase
MNLLFHHLKSIITVCITVFVLSTPLLAQESSSDSWNKAQAEMKAMFGSVPVMFTKLPMHIRASAWEWFKATSNPEATIPPKYGELIGLAVASQIPCDFCVYAHTTMAKMLGATDEEIQEAVEKSAGVRHWSTVLNGNQVSFESFKSNWDDILEFVKENSK